VVAVSETIDRLVQIKTEIDELISKHGQWMSTKGASVYFALKYLERASRYLESEIELLKKVV
jgi:hypothetical protein